MPRGERIGQKRRVWIVISFLALVMVCVAVFESRGHWWRVVNGAKIYYDGKIISGEVYRSPVGWYLVTSSQFLGLARLRNGFVVNPAAHGVCNSVVRSAVGDGIDIVERRTIPTDFVRWPGFAYSYQVPCGCSDYDYYDTGINTNVVLGRRRLEFTGVVDRGMNSRAYDTPRIVVTW